MAAFDYMTNAEMRQCLARDYAELQVAQGAGANKAVLVLAGSIVEAVLVDYLLAYGPKPGKGSGKKGPMELDLAAVIESCHQAGVLSDRTKDLCSAVRAYRNLIHPGRLVRLGETVDENSASVAATVVEIVSDEVEKAFSSRRGLTCEQLTSKIESDPNALPIMPHLVGHYRGRELERLVLEVLPSRYQRLLEKDLDDERLLQLKRSYRSCFEASFARASQAVKKKATQRTLAVVREGGGEAVLSCDDVFLMASGLGHVTGRDRDTLRDHLLARLSDPDEFVLAAAKGIGPYLTSADVVQFYAPLARSVSRGGLGAFQSQQRLVGEYRRMDANCQTTVLSLAGNHIRFWNEKEKWDQAARMKTLIRVLNPQWVDPDEDDDIPF